MARPETSGARREAARPLRDYAGGTRHGGARRRGTRRARWRSGGAAVSKQDGRRRAAAEQRRPSPLRARSTAVDRERRRTAVSIDADGVHLGKDDGEVAAAPAARKAARRPASLRARVGGCCGQITSPSAACFSPPLPQAVRAARPVSPGARTRRPAGCHRRHHDRKRGRSGGRRRRLHRGHFRPFRRFRHTLARRRIRTTLRKPPGDLPMTSRNSELFSRA